MSQDPRTVVRSSTMLWGAQVSQIEALALMDAPAGSPDIETLAHRIEYMQERNRPWIYEFSNGSYRKRFVQNNPVY
jgi:hypothetical protein